MLLLRNLYPGLLHNLGHLDLHDLSPGAAVAALRWWLTDARPGRHELVVGQGNSRKPWRDADLKSAVLKALRKLQIKVLHESPCHGVMDAQSSCSAAGSASPGYGTLVSGSGLPDLTEHLKANGIYEEYLAYRRGYLEWRRGSAVGAQGELTADALEQQTLMDSGVLANSGG
eukprot:g5154.t1